MKMPRGMLLLALCLSLILPLSPVSRAEEPQADTAEDISNKSLVTESSGFSSVNFLFDGDRTHYGTVKENASLTLEHEAGIGSLYLIFRQQAGTYTVTDNGTGESRVFGEEGFLHAWVDLQSAFGTAPTSLTLRFEGGESRLLEMKVFTPGQVPDTVQKWQKPAEGETDLVLFATHSDDDQLFFAGLLPYYVLDRGYQVQVVYLTTHFNTAPFRVHEMLNGLWAVGVRSYPVFGPFPDFGNALSKEGAFQKFEEWGWSRDALNGFIVEQLRRFKPLVAVGHDLNGEYGHNQHKAYAQMVIDGVGLANDPEAFPETAEKYGLWDVPKTYVHLYEENEIVMDFDQPIESFGGMTPYQVSKELGFPCHMSQQKGWSWYLNSSNTAAGLDKYSPCRYGLYRSTVGPDGEKQDMFENLVSYEEQKRLAEEAERLEAERLEAERLEAERLAAEEEARRREELAAQQTTAPAPAETEAPTPEPAEEKPGDGERILILGGTWLALLALVLVLLGLRGRRGRKKGR